MKIVYIGTPDYACVPLDALYNAGYEICLVVTQPDKPKGRGNKMQKSPVKERAEQLGIPVISPDRIKNNPEVYMQISSLAPDFIVVYSYGKIIPEGILNVPKFESLNIHASLLPKYRGAAPIQRSVLDGEEKTGVTIMRMEAGLDTGAMYAQAETPIERKTSKQLFDELSLIGADLLLETIPKIAEGNLTAIPQPKEGWTYAKMIFKDEGEINWENDFNHIDRLVRAFNDAPIAWTKLDEEVLKVYEVEPGNTCREKCGTVLSSGKKGIEVACNGQSLYITKLQAPGKKMMDASAYILGKKIENGTQLG